MLKLNLMKILKFSALIIVILITIALTIFGPRLLRPKSTPAIAENQPSTGIVKTNGHVIYAEVAETPEKRQLGLSNRPGLEENAGMLFLMDAEGIHNFWMKDMLIPLDFIWIRGDQIVDLNENVLPPTLLNGEIKTVQPREAADKVLEVRAGKLKEMGVKKGDLVEVSINL